jgi:hypothetical protein
MLEGMADSLHPPEKPHEDPWAMGSSGWRMRSTSKWTRPISGQRLMDTVLPVTQTQWLGDCGGLRQSIGVDLHAGALMR